MELLNATLEINNTQAWMDYKHSLLPDNTSPLPTASSGTRQGRPQSPEFLSNTDYACNSVLVPLICCLGILGNGLSLCVLTRREMAAATTCFLTAMAVSDLLLLSIQVPTFFQLNPTVAAGEGFNRFIRFYTIMRYVMTNVFITCTCWLTVAVTTERFISLRFMFHPRLVCTENRARVAVIGVFLLSFIFHFSKFFEYVPNEDLSSTRLLLETYLVHTPDYETYLHVTNILLAAIIPVFLLVVANSFLVFFLATHRRRMMRHRKASTASAPTMSNASTSTTLQTQGACSNSSSTMSSVDMMHVSAIVVATVLVFIACHSVGVYLALTIASRGRPWVFARPAYLAMKHVNTVLIMFNSSVNFLLYCAISRKFRKVFIRVFRRRLASWGIAGKQVTRREQWTTAIPLSEGDTLGRSRSINTEGIYRQHPQHALLESVQGSKVYSSSSKSVTSNGSFSQSTTMRADV
ncbi:peptide receptor gpcr [Plakobranchus ocellatus]|uniref:Peptide receptor gpcr n=1 Tax=Plakobranchus ocellatus TaxID=259542 RepID=A0AAV4D9V8_9GAST|nr:peptide receptor gpcr [Plakobranchus ocellatus]